MLRPAFLAALAATLALAACGRGGDKTDAIRYETAPVDRATITAKVSASGALSALVTVQVGSQVSGRILTINKDFNDLVKKGEVLATIDPQIFKAAVEMARANRTAAQGALAKAKVQELDAKRQFDRTKDLFAKGIASPQDMDTSEANFKAGSAQVVASQGQVEQSIAALDQAQVNLDYTTIVSPINGIVVSRNVDIGQTVAASLQTPTLFLIAEDLKKMQVDTSVAEADVGRLKAGMDAPFTVDAFPNERFTGKIRQVRNAATTVQNVVTYDAVIDVSNPDLKFRPGMTANVVIISANRENALRVPNAALRFRPPPAALKEFQAGRGAGSASASTGAPSGARPGGAGGENASPDSRVVWILKDDKPQPRRVRIGITDGSFTEVVEGSLKEGDLVITNTIGSGASTAPRFRVL